MWTDDPDSLAFVRHLIDLSPLRCRSSRIWCGRSTTITTARFRWRSGSKEAWPPSRCWSCWAWRRWVHTDVACVCQWCLLLPNAPRKNVPLYWKLIIPKTKKTLFPNCKYRPKMHFTAELTNLNQTWTVSHLLLHVHYRYHEAEGHLMNFTLTITSQQTSQRVCILGVTHLLSSELLLSE